MKNYQLQGKNCHSCIYCNYILEGDFLCEKELDQGDSPIYPIMEDFSPTEHFFWCKGKYWVNNM